MSASTMKAVVTVQLGVAAIAAFLGPIDMMVYALAVLLVLDYISGIMVAAMKGNLSSWLGFVGLFKKTGYVMIAAAFFWTGQTLGIPVFLRNMAITIIVVNELVSMLENFNRLEGRKRMTALRPLIAIVEDYIHDNYVEAGDEQNS